MGDEAEEGLVGSAHGAKAVDCGGDRGTALVGELQRGEVDHARRLVAEPGDRGNRGVRQARVDGAEPCDPRLLGVVIGLRRRRPRHHLSVDRVEHARDEVADVVGRRQVADNDRRGPVSVRIDRQEVALWRTRGADEGILNLGEHVQLVLCVEQLGATLATHRLQRRDRRVEVAAVGDIPQPEGNALEIADEGRRTGHELAAGGGIQCRPPGRDLLGPRLGGDQLRDRVGMLRGEGGELVGRQQGELVEQAHAGEAAQLRGAHAHGVAHGSGGQLRDARGELGLIRWRAERRRDRRNQRRCGDDGSDRRGQEQGERVLVGGQRGDHHLEGDFRQHKRLGDTARGHRGRQNGCVEQHPHSLTVHGQGFSAQSPSVRHQPKPDRALIWGVNRIVARPSLFGNFWDIRGGLCRS